MKIFPAEDVRLIDAYTIENEPIASIDLMERAASVLLNWIVKHYKTNQRIIVFAGPGNNGGDGLALSRMLQERNFKVKTFIVSTSGKYSADCLKNLHHLEKIQDSDIARISKTEHFPELASADIIVDALFGSGLNRPLEALYKELVQHINASGAEIISIDIPSGLFAEDNADNDLDSIIRARFTLSFQFPFLSFFFAENHAFTGRWILLDIGLHPIIIEERTSSYSWLLRTDVSPILKERKPFDHKGSFGHALVAAGSYGMVGAAILAGKAALRSGAGLVSLHVPSCAYEIVQSSVPELIVSVDEDKNLVTTLPDLKQYSALAMGPGMRNTQKLKNLLSNLPGNSKLPVVLDADALNSLAEDDELKEKLSPGTILTPHPGEFDRLAGASKNAFDRHRKQLEFAAKYSVIVILKGAYTGIALPDGRYFFNSTGNPGMASGGSGDVLTGIIVSLLACGYVPEEAAIVGVYLHGLAADLALESQDQESLIAGDIINYLGMAFKEIKSSPFLHEGRRGNIIQ